MKRNIGSSPAQPAQAICLQNERMEVTILPAAGGNISAIIDRRSGHDWLWQNPHIPISNIRSGDDYGRQLDSGGWDEILLSISADQVELSDKLKQQIDDHGDLVRRQWTASVRTNDNGEKVCETTVTGRSFDYEFRRVVTLRSDRPCMDIEYTFQNRGIFALPWYWCAHALLDMNRSTKIDLPDGLPFRVEGDAQRSEFKHRWPTLKLTRGETIDLSESFVIDGAARHFARKIFVRTPQDGTISVETLDTNERLTVRFEPEVLPWVGLWINNRGWSGCESEPYLNLGLEPTTTPYDKVSDAIDCDAIEWLEPGKSRQWRLNVAFAS